MNRRSFMAGLAGLPMAGLGARMCGLPKSKAKAKSGITVYGPEVILIHGGRNKPIDKGTVVELPAGYDAYQPSAALSLRFKNVPFRKNSVDLVRQMFRRLKPIGGVVNRSDWYWHGDAACGVEGAGTLMFTDWGVAESENGLCSVVCVFTSALDRQPWPSSHRPVDFETEILKALEGKGHGRRSRG